MTAPTTLRVNAQIEIPRARDSLYIRSQLGARRPERQQGRLEGGAPLVAEAIVSHCRTLFAVD